MPTHATVLLRGRPITDRLTLLEQRITDEIAVVVQERVRQYAECHWREALPYILISVLNSYQAPVRIAVSAAVLEACAEDGLLDRYKPRLENGRVEVLTDREGPSNLRFPAEVGE